MHVGSELQTFHFGSYSALGLASLLLGPPPLPLALHPLGQDCRRSLDHPEERFRALFAQTPRLQS